MCRLMGHLSSLEQRQTLMTNIVAQSASAVAVQSAGHIDQGQISELYSKSEFGYLLNLVAMVLFEVDVDDVARKFMAAARDRALTDEAITALKQRVDNPVPPYDPLFNEYEDSQWTKEATVRMLDRIERAIKFGFVPLQ